MMNDDMKIKLVLLGATITTLFLLFRMLFVVSPELERAIEEEYEENQEMKRGIIILVVPDEAVYFKDGDIMKGWKSEDYAQFRMHIGMEVTITYGTLGSFSGSYGSKKLFSIVETPYRSIKE